MPTAIDTQLVLHNVRLSFPKLWEATSVDGGKPRYSATLLIDKGDKAQLNAVNAVIKHLVDTEYGGKPLPGDKLPLHDGEEKADKFDGYEGVYSLSANRSSDHGRPNVVDVNKSPLTPDDGKPYAGCYVNAVVRLYALNGKSSKKPNSYGKRICASLEAIQFWRDGDPFGAPKVDLGVLPGGDDDIDSL
jgi:outer membrane protein assembly factor BamB